MDALVERMQRADRVHILGKGTDLTFSIKGLPAIKCDGKLNIPDGEVFTAPVRNSVNGVLSYNTPSLYMAVATRCNSLRPFQAKTRPLPQTQRTGFASLLFKRMLTARLRARRLAASGNVILPTFPQPHRAWCIARRASLPDSARREAHPPQAGHGFRNGG